LLPRGVAPRGRVGASQNYGGFGRHTVFPDAEWARHLGIDERDG
jgi:hypothetical protein